MSVHQARKLRKTASLPERLFWNAIRTATPRIRRQHPIGPYVVDFYCPSARIAVEIDGISHDMGDRPGRDSERDRWIESQAVTIIRVAAAEVLRNPDDVAGAVLQACRTPPPRR